MKKFGITFVLIIAIAGFRSKKTSQSGTEILRKKDVVRSINRSPGGDIDGVNTSAHLIFRLVWE